MCPWLPNVRHARRKAWDSGNPKGGSSRFEQGRDYLSLKLDDPSFNAPIYTNLFEDEGSESSTLL